MDIGKHTVLHVDILKRTWLHCLELEIVILLFFFIQVVSAIVFLAI